MLLNQPPAWQTTHLPAQLSLQNSWWSSSVFSFFSGHVIRDRPAAWGQNTQAVSAWIAPLGRAVFTYIYKSLMGWGRMMMMMMKLLAARKKPPDDDSCLAKDHHSYQKIFLHLNSPCDQIYSKEQIQWLNWVKMTLPSTSTVIWVLSRHLRPRFTTTLHLVRICADKLGSNKDRVKDEPVGARFLSVQSP